MNVVKATGSLHSILDLIRQVTAVLQPVTRSRQLQMVRVTEKFDVIKRLQYRAGVRVEDI